MSGAAEAIRNHCRFWNAMDKASWLALFADDIEYEDPPGTVASRGVEVMSSHAWDGSFTAVKRWILEPVKIIECGREAQVYMRNHGSVDGLPVCVESIELWRVDDAGRVDRIRAFWEPPQDPAVHAHLALAGWEGGTGDPADA
ncbi:MAG: nuclear transport factor 2 family protein [Actinomycetota bacterium]